MEMRNKNNSDKKTKILLVSPMDTDKVGGVVKWTKNIYDYYNNLKSEDIDVIFAYTHNAHIIIKANIFKRIWNGIRNYVPLLKFIKNKILDGNIDVVHVCSSASLSLLKDLLIISYAKKHGVKTVIHFHFGRIPSIYQNKGFEYKLIKRVIYLTDRIIVMDKSSYTTLVNNNITKVSYLPNPLSSDTTTLIKSYENIRRVPNKIVFVGQMIKTKGIYELAKACSTIPNVQLEFIGPFTSKDEQTLFMSIVNAENTKVLGSQPFNIVIKEMLSASIFVLPSYTEGFPNVIIESMACGCPIISTNVGAIPEMLDINGNTPCGVCVNPRDIHGLKDAIIHLLYHPSEASVLGERAKLRVYREYSIDVIWNQLSAIWKMI